MEDEWCRLLRPDVVLEQLQRGEEGVGICCRLGHAGDSTRVHYEGGPRTQAAPRVLSFLEGRRK